MCLIILAPKGEKLPDNKTFDNAFEHNSDGAGYMFAVDGRLVIKKGFFKVAKLIHAIRKDEKAHPDSPFCVHFRWATHGGKSQNNCHPFSVWEGWGMAHNGVISIVGSDDKHSDTAVFAHILLKLSTPKQCLEAAEGKQELGKLIGSGNKLVFLHKSGRSEIINEQQGVWDNGCWYSNTNYKTPKWIGYRLSSWDGYEDYDYSKQWTKGKDYTVPKNFGADKLPKHYLESSIEADDVKIEIEIIKMELAKKREQLARELEKGKIGEADVTEYEIQELEKDLFEYEKWDSPVGED